MQNILAYLQANQGLRLEMAELRRGTADSLHLVSQRMDSLEAAQKVCARGRCLAQDIPGLHR